MIEASLAMQLASSSTNYPATPVYDPAFLALQDLGTGFTVHLLFSPPSYSGNKDE
jgi:hypothetical protein